MGRTSLFISSSFYLSSFSSFTILDWCENGANSLHKIYSLFDVNVIPILIMDHCIQYAVCGGPCPNQSQKSSAHLQSHRYQVDRYLVTCESLPHIAPIRLTQIPGNSTSSYIIPKGNESWTGLARTREKQPHLFSEGFHWWRPHRLEWVKLCTTLVEGQLNYWQYAGKDKRLSKTIKIDCRCWIKHL